MKAFTDIKQSKKLVEILPIESADMRYGYIAPYDYSDRMYDGGYDEIPYPKDFLIKNSNFSTNEYDAELPCWSLAALLDYLAKKDCFPEVTYTGTCYLMDVNFYDDEEGKLLHPIHFIRTEGESLVDVTIEMILKLHEEKLL